MLKDMKLGYKIGGGFAIVLLLTILVAYMGWSGMSGVVSRAENAEDANGLIKNMLEAREEGKAYIINGNTKHIDGLAAYVEELKKDAGELKAKFKDQANIRQIDQAVEGFEKYGSNFGHYADFDQKGKVLGGEWRKVGEDFAAITGTVLNDNIIPEMEKAAASKNVSKLEKWSEINTIFTNDVINNFLLLRISAIYFLMKKGPEQWDAFNKAVVVLNKGLENWAEAAKGNKALESAGRNIVAGIDKYKATGAEFYQVFNEQKKTNKLMLEAAVNVQKVLDENTADQKNKMESQIKSANMIIIAAAVIAIILGTLIAVVITLLITKPVAKSVELANAVAVGDLSKTLDIDQKDEIGVLVASMQKMVSNLKVMAGLAEKIAEGDLTVDIQTLSDKDVLGHALKNMVKKLGDTVSEINVSSSNVAAGSEEMSSTSQSMSQGATEQASSLEEITSSMNEIGSQTKQNAENSSQANQLANDTKNAAEQGNTQMKEMVGAMEDINASSQEISKIIKTIDEIAFQTNLLALNAAVEAARAGKQGKGFAVVAEEVRNLAARSAKAAKETADMIEGSVKKVEGGTSIASKTAEALEEIVNSVTKVTDLVAEIAAASNEQAQGISQITQGLGQIDQVTQQNTAHAEESASAAEELSSQAMLLQQLIATFKVDNSQQTQQNRPSSAPVKQNRMLSATPKAPENKGGGSGQESWGGAAQETPEPTIHLDDKEFGKY